MTYNKKIEVNKNYDVIVVGGGTSGVIAAISAAKEGMKVLILEELSSLGGTQTNALVTPIMGARVNGATAHGSISYEINEMYQEIDGHLSDSSTSLTYFFPMTMKIVYARIIEKYGIDVLYNAKFVDAIKKDDEIDYLVVALKLGLQGFKAQAYIDTTGDALVALSLGAANVMVYEETGRNQAVSLRFELNNVDLDKTGKMMEELGQPYRLKYPFLSLGRQYIAPLLEEGVKNGDLLPLDLSHFQAFSMPGKVNTLCFNCPELGVLDNVFDDFEMSKKVNYGYEAVLRMATFVRKYFKGCEDATVSNIASMVGVRQSVALDALYTLTIEEVFAYKKFNDGIAFSNYPVDIHGAKEMKLEYDLSLPISERYYEIPFRTLIPKTINNLIVAGRSSGFDFGAQSSARVQHTCRAMGEAAGIGASLMVKNNLNNKEINGEEVRKIILTRGGDFPENA